MTIFSGRKPRDLGVHDGRLRDCPSSPNCVCSDASRDSHQVDAFRLVRRCGLNLDFDFTANERYPDGVTVRRVFDEQLVRRSGDWRHAVPGGVLLLKDLNAGWPMHMGIVGDASRARWSSYQE